MYLEFYRSFAPTRAESEPETSWSKAEQFYAPHQPIRVRGNYGWAYPSIANSNPWFRDLAKSVDANSRFLNEYYDVAVSKALGRFMLGF